MLDKNGSELISTIEIKKMLGFENAISEEAFIDIQDN
jgi:hypothetical protein